MDMMVEISEQELKRKEYIKNLDEEQKSLITKYAIIITDICQNNNLSKL